MFPDQLGQCLHRLRTGLPFHEVSTYDKAELLLLAHDRGPWFATTPLDTFPWATAVMRARARVWQREDSFSREVCVFSLTRNSLSVWCATCEACPFFDPWSIGTALEGSFAALDPWPPPISQRIPQIIIAS